MAVPIFTLLTVATTMTKAFQKNEIYMARQFTKILEILDKIDDAYY
jgi:hypothetical protein